jgi:hypothetical protein
MAAMGKGYHASKWRSVTYFVVVRATARRTLPVKGEDFLDSFAAVHESGYGPSRPRRSSAFVSVNGGLSAAPAHCIAGPPGARINRGETWRPVAPAETSL